jgi:hypothetical protein
VKCQYRFKGYVERGSKRNGFIQEGGWTPNNFYHCKYDKEVSVM